MPHGANRVKVAHRVTRAFHAINGRDHSYEWSFTASVATHIYDDVSIEIDSDNLEDEVFFWRRGGWCLVGGGGLVVATHQAL